MTDLTIKSCPFCGGEASKRLFYKGKYRVHCNVCDAHSGDVCDTEAEAIAAWNARADYHGFEQAAIEAWESIKAWNARADSYTREDVESAFVSGYSLGTLPVGSDPRWDQNETTLEEEMEELGWVRKQLRKSGDLLMAYGEFYVERQGWARWPKTLIMCRKRGREIIERRRYIPERTCKPTESERCLHGTDCPAWLCSECGELFELGTNFCSNCGAKVIQEKGKGNDEE